MNALPARLADVSAECFVLSSAVYREDWLLDVLQKVNVHDFTRDETRAMFSVISNMHERGETISLETVALHGKELSEAGYVAGRDLTLSAMIGNPPIDTDVSSYISTLKELTMRRHIYRAAQTAAHMIEQGEMSDAALSEMERVVMEKTATGMTREMMSPSDMGDAIEAAVKERMNSKAIRNRVLYSTFGRLNNCAGGFEKGDLVILSAESGAGKSAFAMNLAYGIAVTMKRPLLYLNSEMSKNQFALRWASFLAKVSHSALRNGKATQMEAKSAIDTGAIMRNSTIWTLNMPDMQIASVLAEVRRAKAQHNIEMAIVDYIGRMDTMNAKDRGEEWQMMKSGAQRLKTLAQELDITVVMVAQLTSDGARLAQSSYMVHEADLWMNLSRIKEEDLQKAAPWNYFLKFRKARNVQVGREIPLRFDGDTMRFTDVKEDAEDMAKATQGVPL